MKNIITTCLLIIFPFLNAQEIKTIELLPPDSNDYSDLHFLEEELKGKQVVMLGEQTHMYGNIFEMKARVVEYLHQELGYATFAMESSMYDIWKMNQEGFDPVKFNNAIFGVWSNTEEFQRLVRYIDNNDLKVIGFDSQVMNTSTFIDDFFDYCEDQNISIKLDEDEMGIVMEGILENYSYEDYDIKFGDFEKQLNRIISKISKLEPSDKNFHWKHFSKNLLTQARDANTVLDIDSTTAFINKGQNLRDKQMADNFLAYLDRTPNEKIMIWADNIHVMSNNSSIDMPVAEEFVSMGNHIKRELAEKVYSLATIHANDSLFHKKWHQTPVLKGSFEDKIKKNGQDYLFVSSDQQAMKKMQKTRLLSYEDFFEIRMDEVHDGYVFFKHSTLPKKDLEMLDEKEELIKKKEGEKAIQKEIQKNLITLTGRILDSDTNEPVSFANIILKEQELYRVADENGYFTLTVNQRMFDNASAEISSMGFEASTIELKKLKDKTYLTPSFESLGEVVITAHLTPLSVLKKAVKSKYDNHTDEDFNYYRYSNSIINLNDETKLDLDLITKNHAHGFSSDHRATMRVEQTRWNKNLFNGSLKFTEQLFRYREDAIRYSNILHKRKYKKFDLEFVSSDLAENKGLYIISFRTGRNRWNYTNRGYPTEYSGKVYIDKQNFAIIRVEETWETHLDEEEIEKYHKKTGDYKDEVSVTIKEEYISYYNKIVNGKYYPSAYFNRTYKERKMKDGKINYSTFENNSYLYDHELEDVEEIEYEFYGDEEQTVIDRVEFNAEFWNTFNIDLRQS